MVKPLRGLVTSRKIRSLEENSYKFIETTPSLHLREDNAQLPDSNLKVITKLKEVSKDKAHNSKIILPY